MRLWLSAWINFSVLPLRARDAGRTADGGRRRASWHSASSLALVWDAGRRTGWGWIMAALLVFSGTQLVMLGLIGEYLGRMFLTVNQRPQSVVREVVSSRSHPDASREYPPESPPRRRQGRSVAVDRRRQPSDAQRDHDEIPERAERRDGKSRLWKP